MESELLKIFDDNGLELGVATREEVHKYGYWHETFHCWIINKEDGMDYLYFQLRSNRKKDYPNLLDITAAGHLLADETIADGVREVKEELGLDVALNELVSLGIERYAVEKGNLIDKELANVFLYNHTITMDDFELQQEEVTGIVRAEFTSFKNFWLDDEDEVEVEGFKFNESGEKVMIKQKVGKTSFVNHEGNYYESVFEKISNYIKG